MKRIAFLFSLLFFFLITVHAQKSYSAKTGDKELDANLRDMNLNAHVDLPLFKKNLSVDFGIEEGKLDHLMVSYNLQPADLYMVLQIGTIIKKPYEEVGEFYKTNKGKGWGVIAKELGIKPGSKEFHMLKDSVKGKDKKMKQSHGNKGGKEKGNSGNGKGKGKKK